MKLTNTHINLCIKYFLLISGEIGKKYMNF